MSTQKGNCNRSRAQKHQNTKVFKNNLYDTSKKTKTINKIKVTNVCDRCKAILEWKIKYKKYKMLKNPSTCCKCHNKCVKESYHTICEECSKKLNVCPKCGKSKESADLNINNNLEKELFEDEDEIGSNNSD
ncbi:uncharacterized protein C9orf85 homolog isoform X2 [Lycorma delicatula]